MKKCRKCKKVKTASSDGYCFNCSTDTYKNTDFIECSGAVEFAIAIMKLSKILEE